MREEAQWPVRGEERRGEEGREMITSQALIFFSILYTPRPNRMTVVVLPSSLSLYGKNAVKHSVNASWAFHTTPVLWVFISHA